MPADPKPLAPIVGAKVLALLGDSITTDHISPAGNISKGSPAAKYLEANGVAKADWNSYGSRRGNDRVMTRGTFANIRIKNLMVPGVEGGVTVHQPSGERMSIFDAAMQYKAAGVPSIVLAGKEYGTGSSRDWAAKGPYLQGVRAVIAESFERIHRSNLVGMGILPLQFKDGQNAESLGLTGREIIDIVGLDDNIKPRQQIVVRAQRVGLSDEEKQLMRDVIEFPVTVRIDTPIEVEYYRNGGILQTVLRKLVKEA